MVKKTIYFDVMLKSSDRINLNDFKASQKVMTNDKNSVDIVFRATDVEPNDLNGATASIFLYMQDGSFFQSNSVVITNNILTYTMTQNQTQHKGTTKVQIVVKSGTIDNASLLQEFEISPGLEKYPLTEVMIQDWTTLTEEAKAFVEQIEDFTLAEFVENKMGEELANLEVNYATRLTGLESNDANLTAQLAQKASKEELNSLGQLKLEGQYDTLSALQTAKPTGATGLYLVVADGFTYRWNGSVWVKAVQFQSTGIATGSITPHLLKDQYPVGKNLFDKYDIVSGKWIDPATGNLLDYAPRFTSNYIPVSANTDYILSVSAERAFYDANKVFISSLTGVDPNNFTTPANAKFMRFSSGITYVDTTQLELGTTITAYEDYKFTMKGLSVTLPSSNYYVLDTIQKITATPTGSGFIFNFSDDSSYGNTLYLYDNKNKLVIEKKLNSDYSITVPSWGFLVWNIKTNTVSVVQESSSSLEDTIILLSVSPHRISSSGVLRTKIVGAETTGSNGSLHNVAFEGVPYVLSSDFNVNIKFDKVLITTPKTYYAATWDMIISQITPIENGYYVKESPEWVKNTIFINYKKALVFDLVANTFNIISLNDKYTNPNYVVIAQNQDAKLTGAFADYYLSYMDKDRDHKTNYIRRDYLPMIEAKENEVIPLLSDDTFLFGFSTDMHVQEWENGFRNVTYNVMDRLRKTLGFDCIINGGDTVSFGRSDKTKAYGALKSIMSKFASRENLYHIIGNHDYNGRSDAPNGRQLKTWTVTPTESYNILGRHLNDVVWGSKEWMYFYKDFADKKIRVVFLNTSDTGLTWVPDAEGDYLRVDPLIVGGIRQTQFQWLCNTALNFSDKTDKTEWHTMIVQHIGLYSDPEGLTWNQQNLENQLALRNVLKSFKNGTSTAISYTDTKYNGTFNINLNTSFATQGAMNLIGVWSGHNHLDRLVRTDEIINITTTSGLPDPNLIQKDPTMTRNVNTYEEFALDVVIIDKAKRKVTFKRFGAGSDREFTY